MVAQTVVPVPQEAGAKGLLKPRRRRLQRADIVPLHSSLGNKRKTQSQKRIQLLVTCANICSQLEFLLRKCDFIFYPIARLQIS